MIARPVTRGASLALFVALEASLALGAEPGTTPAGDKAASAKPADAKPADAKPADVKPADVKPADVKLEEAASAPDAPASDRAPEPASAEGAGDAGDAESEPKKSPGLEFIKARRKTASDETKDDASEADDEPSGDFRQSERDEPEEVDDGLLGSHQEHFFLGIGPRVGFIDDDGLDAFSTTDAFTQSALFGGLTLYVDGDVSVAALIEWNYGERAAKARGLDAELGVHRVSLGAEGRYHVFRRLYGYVRVAPGALYTWAKLNQLETTAWAFSADASLGAAFEVFGAKSGETNKPRGWVSLNAGYGFGTETDLTLSPAEGSRSPERTASLELDALSMTGPFVGGAVSLSY